VLDARRAEVGASAAVGIGEPPDGPLPLAAAGDVAWAAAEDIGLVEQVDVAANRAVVAVGVAAAADGCSPVSVEDHVHIERKNWLYRSLDLHKKGNA